MLTATLCVLSFLAGALATVLVYPRLMVWAARDPDEDGDDEPPGTGDVLRAGTYRVRWDRDGRTGEMLR